MTRIALPARVLMWAAIFVAVTMALLPHPPSLPIDSYGDKFEHMLAFATITLLAAIGYRTVPMVRMAEHLSFLGALIEIAQSLPMLGRDCDIRDWFADTVAVLAVLAAVAIGRRLRRRPAAT